MLRVIEVEEVEHEKCLICQSFGKLWVFGLVSLSQARMANVGNGNGSGFAI